MHDATRLIVSHRVRITGTSTRTLERGARDGRFVRLRPGVYLPTDEWTALDDAGRHLALMLAVVETAGRRVVFSHESAALLHGLPLMGPFPAVPQLTEPDDVVTRHPRVGTRTHYRALPEAEVAVVRGWECTTPARTAIDIAAARAFTAGVVAVDAAMGRRSAVSREELFGMVEQRGRFPGSGRVARVLSTATGLADSPLESASLAFFVERRIPTPAQQVEFTIDGSRYRADFYWEGPGVIGEADGRGKYDDPREIIREKRREDSLRSVVDGFARWGWPELTRPSTLLARLARAGVHPVPRFASR